MRETISEISAAEKSAGTHENALTFSGVLKTFGFHNLCPA
jgi:hypothetical protein